MRNKTLETLYTGDCHDNHFFTTNRKVQTFLQGGISKLSRNCESFASEFLESLPSVLNVYIVLYQPHNSVLPVSTEVRKRLSLQMISCHSHEIQFFLTSDLLKCLEVLRHIKCRLRVRDFGLLDFGLSDFGLFDAIRFERFLGRSECLLSVELLDKLLESPELLVFL